MSRQRGFTARVLWDSNLHDLATYIAAAVVIRNNCFVLQALWLRQQSRAAPDFTAQQAMPPKGMPQPPPPPPMPPINADALRDQIVALAVEEIDWEQVQAAAAAGPRPMPQKRTEVEKKEAKAAKRQRQKNAKALGNGVGARHQSAEEESSTVSSQSRPGRTTALDNVASPNSSAKAASGSGQVTYTGVAIPSSSAAAASVPRDSRPVPPGALERVQAAMQVVSDSDSVDYGSNSEDIPDKPKNQLDCMHAGGEDGCGSYNLMWSQFMLVQPTEGEADASWSGKLWGTCQKCSGLEPRTFKREARRRQEIRAKTLRGHRIRSKTMTFKTMRAHIKAKFKGGTNAQIRDLTMQRMKVAAAAFALAFDRHRYCKRKPRRKSWRTGWQQWNDVPRTLPLPHRPTPERCPRRRRATSQRSQTAFSFLTCAERKIACSLVLTMRRHGSKAKVSTSSAARCAGTSTSRLPHMGMMFRPREF